MKGDQMGILAAYPTQRELPLSNQTRFNLIRADVLQRRQVIRQSRVVRVERGVNDVLRLFLRKAGGLGELR